MYGTAIVHVLLLLHCKIKDKSKEIYVCGDTYNIVPCNEVCEISGDGDSVQSPKEKHSDRCKMRLLPRREVCKYKGVERWLHTLIFLKIKFASEKERFC